MFRRTSWASWDVSMPFSPIFPPSPSPTESIRLFYMLQGWDAGLATGGCVREGVSGEAREAAGPDWEVLTSLPEPGFSPEPWEGSRQGRVDLYFLWGMVGRPLQTLGVCGPGRRRGERQADSATPCPEDHEGQVSERRPLLTGPGVSLLLEREEAETRPGKWGRTFTKPGSRAFSWPRCFWVSSHHQLSELAQNHAH